ARVHRHVLRHRLERHRIRHKLTRATTNRARVSHQPLSSRTTSTDHRINAHDSGPGHPYRSGTNPGRVENPAARAAGARSAHSSAVRNSSPREADSVSPYE